MAAPDKNSEEIFYRAIEITDAAERAAFLDEACGADRELRARVEALLKAHERAGDFLAPPVGSCVTLDGPAKIEGPGTTIGRYELLELIGEGGMGLVYLAEQKEPIRRKVAFKIIKPGMDSRQVIARFEAERQTLAVLDHPNIAHVFDAGCTETGRPYFVMEHVKGMSITRYCDEHKLTIEQRLRLFEQVCEGVQHAHQKGIIHRDLKPSNILVSVHGDRATPKIIDFGIAKAITQPLTDKTFVTFQGQLLGTPEYMSPEQVDLATQDIDTRSDIYSLGIVLYELLAGVLPFESESFAKAGLAEIQQTIRDQEPTSPSIRLTSLGERAHTIAASRGTQVVPLARRLHRELEWIPLKAMRKDRCRRYKSASEMADDIRNYLNGNPLLAGPETAIYRVQKFVHKHAGSVATVALVAVAIVLGLVVSTAMYFKAEDARQKENAARTQAQQAERVAKDQRALAEKAKEATEQKAEDLRRSLYVNSIQLADAQFREGNIRRVHELLNSCPNDLRSWEWHRLNFVSDQSVRTLGGNDEIIHSVTLDTNGRAISAGWDKTVRVWELATGKQLAVLTGHKGLVNSVAASPDGRQVISADSLGEIKIWEAAAWREMATIQAHGKSVNSVAFSPDGKRFASGGEDKTIKIWDSDSRGEPQILGRHEASIGFVAFSPGGNRLLSGDDNGVIRIWNIETRAEVMTLHGHGCVTSGSFSPNGSQIATCGLDQTIKLWDANSGKEIATLRGHRGFVDCVAYAPDGERIVSGGRDNAIKIWDVKTGEVVMTLRGHTYPIGSVAFTPDGKQIVSGGWDNTIKVWNAEIDREQMTLPAPGYSIAFSPDGTKIATATRIIRLWDVNTGAEVAAFGRSKASIYSVVFSPDGKQVACSGEDLRLFDLATQTQTMRLGDHEGPFTSIAFSPDGRRIISGGRGKTVQVWDAATGAELMALSGHEGTVDCVTFSPDGRLMASSGRDETIRLWNSSTGDLLTTIATGKARGFRHIAFSPDGKSIACSGEDVTIFDVATRDKVMVLRGHLHIVDNVAFSPDGNRIISTSRDGTAKLWDAASGVELLTLREEYTSVSMCQPAFSPDGGIIAAGTFGETMLWESSPPHGGYEPRVICRDARRAVDQEYEKLGSYHETVQSLQNNKTLNWSVGRLALQIANSRTWEDAEKLKNEAWQAVSSPGKGVEVYRAALEKAQKANGWEPNDPAVLATLGAAQYRTRAYEQAWKTLTVAAKARADKRDESNPAALAFTAMALHQLGRADEAKAALEELRGLLKEERFTDDKEAKALLAEAEGVIESGKK